VALATAALVALALALPAAALANGALPPDAEGALAALEGSPRHGEYVDIKVADGSTVNAWVVYPERAEKAGAVIVIHEIFGLSDWIRAVADQLAEDGFIAIAPDMLSGKGPDGGGTASLGDQVVSTIRGLESAEVIARLDAVRAYVRGLPAANGKVGTVGFCWGGSTSFAYATAQPELDAAIVYYGGSPAEPDSYTKIGAPVLGLYGGDDARVNATIPTAEAEMTKNGKSFAKHVYDGAGHGFLRQQTGRDANMKATEQAWPATLAFFREHLE
jgi:carboxymethylenebutenolidase